MRIVFWQNCLSPHQLPYICHLMDDDRVDEVIIVAEEEISAERKRMGWQLGDYCGIERCKLYIKPDDGVIYRLLEEKQDESVHLFSGIHSFPYIFKCLKMSLSYKIKRGIITEIPYTYAWGCKNGKPLWLHRIRFFLQDKKYAKKMDYVFAMGKKATRYFQSVHKGWNVFPFIYCTTSGNESYYETEFGMMKVLFVGSLNRRKSPELISYSLAACIRRNNDFKIHVTYIGDGEKRAEINRIIKKNHIETFVTFAGFQHQNKILSWMVKNDILILPSIHDGWGAVVNEALHAGMYVICSDACGASDLLEDKRIGQKFQAGNVQQLTDILEWCNKYINEIRANRDIRRQWAEEHISGKVVAKYMVDCLSKFFNNK